MHIAFKVASLCMRWLLPAPALACADTQAVTPCAHELNTQVVGLPHHQHGITGALLTEIMYDCEHCLVVLFVQVEVCCFDKTGTLTTDHLLLEGLAGLPGR